MPWVLLPESASRRLEGSPVPELVSALRLSLRVLLAALAEAWQASLPVSESAQHRRVLVRASQQELVLRLRESAARLRVLEQQVAALQQQGLASESASHPLAMLLA